ncbi:hypothetical protein [uncultured Roseobacter sp.]|uniref:hypothetical protein n=1 Tax=uncultured Roseobacter sp. TaxID=114847 RepID=UPI00262CFDFE|nr:hypothetical protein [uncultured Roseobacter sp.]
MKAPKGRKNVDLVKRQKRKPLGRALDLSTITIGDFGRERLNALKRNEKALDCVNRKGGRFCTWPVIKFALRS